MIQVIVLAPALAVRAGLRAILSADENIEVAAEAASLSAPHALPQEVDLIVTFADALRGPELEDYLQQLPEPPALLLLSDQPADAAPLPKLPLRAWGLLPQDAAEDDLLTSAYTLYSGLITADPALLQPLLSPQPNPVDDSIVEDLTNRELEVLELLAEGLANKQIALELEISQHTVKFHISSIYNKLGVTNRTEAVMTGARLGLIVL